MPAIDPAHLVGAGGAFGALLRHAVSRRLQHDAFPVGTLTVNVVGSFALGLLTFAGAGREALLLFGVGACGSFTTFSSFSFDTVRLFEAGEARRGIANALGNLAGALAAIGLAWLLAAVAGLG